jgi:hypothetical protein
MAAAVEDFIGKEAAMLEPKLDKFEYDIYSSSVFRAVTGVGRAEKVT